MPLKIRPATSADVPSIISAFDSTLPFLSSVGSAAQWGSTPFSERNDFNATIADTLAKVQTYRETSTGPALWAFTAESVDDNDGDAALFVGTATVKDAWFPGYVSEQLQFDGEVKGAKNWIYLHVLVTNFTAAKERRKGAGRKLVERVRELAVELGRDVVYVDCWAGNEKKLVSYYKRQGFSEVGEFETKDARGPWSGMLLRMDIKNENRVHEVSTT